MKSILKVIENAVKNLKPPNVLTGVVTKVKEDCCVVEEDATGKVFFKVAYNAIIDNGDDQIIVKPKENAQVLFVVAENNQDAYLVSHSAIEEIKGSLGLTSFLLDKNGYKIESEGENLKTVINDLINQINLIVVNPDSGITPNVAAINAIQARLNKILQ